MRRRRLARHRTLAVLTAALTTAVVLGACGSGDAGDPRGDAAGETTTSTSDASATSSETGATPLGDASSTGAGVLDISAGLVGGGQIDLAAYGDRPLLLWFWAPF